MTGHRVAIALGALFIGAGLVAVLSTMLGVVALPLVAFGLFGVPEGYGALLLRLAAVGAGSLVLGGASMAVAARRSGE